MPINSELTSKVWNRYAWARDNGHAAYVEKADLCERYFAGDQWDAADKAKLKQQRRPALTINKIISTLSNIMGEQIYNRSEINFRPRSGAPDDTAEALVKVFKQISDNNQLDWKRSDMFADGVITGRGFLDVRLNFTDSMQGEVRIDKINAKNVIVDPDAEDYDPDTWNEVFVTKWMTADDVCILYNKEDGEALRNRSGSFFQYGFDIIHTRRDRFGDNINPAFNNTYDESSVMRSVRVVERQYRILDRQKHFFSPETGDMREIPKDFTRDRIAWFVEKFGFQVVPKLVHRIKWCVIADNFVLHEEWSPYKHFTIVPYFPIFRHGKTIGLVENLIGPQELLNKVSSQELHVVNTTANSGWKVKAGALTNMAIEELENRGAESGLVIEVNGDADRDVVKIQPNQIPTGLERISYKAEEQIKTISGVSDSMQGFDREDVAAKAIKQKRQAGTTNLAKPLDSLVRSDFILARNILDLVQGFYTEPRLLTITKDRMSGETETIGINQPTPEGTIANDLMLGEYDVVISSVPQRETLEDSQFDQAISLRQLGVGIPDEVLIESSRLLNKRDIVTKMSASATSPEAQQQKQLTMRGQSAEVHKTESEAAAKAADADLKRAKIRGALVSAHKQDIPPPDVGNELKLTALQHKVMTDNNAAAAEAKIAADQAMKERVIRYQLAAKAALKSRPT